MKSVTKIFITSFGILFLGAFFTVAIMAQTNTVRTRVGNPKGGDGGWPTTGVITQGPLGGFDHGPNGLNALDIANPSSPPVYSAFDGTVSAIHDCSLDGDCSRGWGGYGNSIEISNNGGGSALYGHLSVIEVSAGQTVSKGDEIGIMGTTGVSTGIHLHFELRGLPLTPPYIPIEITPKNCDTPSIPCNPSSI